MTTTAHADRLAFLPTPPQSLLLRAALLSGDAARTAWDRWTIRSSSLRGALGSVDRLTVKRLLPLLLFSVKRNGLDADPEALVILKSAYTAEAVRDIVCRRLGRAVIRELTNARLDPIVWGGFALSETVYAEPALRHCHTIELHVADADPGRVRGAMSRIRFSPNGESRSSLRFVHPTGLPVVVHRQLVAANADSPWARGIAERCEERSIAGTPAKVVGSVDALLQACVSGASGEAGSCPLWICDAWLLLARLQPSHWSLAWTIARSADLEKVFGSMVDYLRSELDADAPVRPIR